MRNILEKYTQKTFGSLLVRNYRLYFIGQVISLCGTWMQTIGQGLLVLKLTGSGTTLGIVTALQYLPILLFGPFGGVIADKYSKRKLLYFTQASSGVLALILGILVITNTAQVWMIELLALGLGFINTIDNPTRQTFLLEMVGKEKLQNAVVMNSTEVSFTRIIGPALAAILIAAFGIGICFLINAFSYIAVLFVLFFMNTKEFFLHEKKSTKQNPLIELKQGFAYVASSPILKNTLIMMAIIGTLTYEFQVILPLFATFTFHNQTTGYAILTSAMGIGAVIGGLSLGGRNKISSRMLISAAIFLGISLLSVSISPTLEIATLTMVFAGICSINFISLANTTLQLSSTHEMRGRVMSLWTMAFLGSTPIGGPIIGFVGEHFGARWGLAIGGLAAIAAGGFGILAQRRERSKATMATVQVPESVEIETEKNTREL